MFTRNTRGTAGTPLSLVELSALRSLHASYEPVQHVITERELAWPRFLRWLVHSPVWNRVRVRADVHETIVLADHEPPGSSEVLSWTPGSIE